MPSFQDSIVIFFIALLIFGPKKLPELARQLGKLMAEFRRASNEFRMQMEDELRISEQEEQQKKIAAMEAAAPITPAIAADGETENSIAFPAIEEPLEVHPHMLPPEEFEPHPIATSGDLSLMPPSTGLPTAAASVSQALEAIPHVADPETSSNMPQSEALPTSSTDDYAAQQRPDRTVDHATEPAIDGTIEPAAEALHG